jgi:hypothetical protein
VINLQNWIVALLRDLHTTTSANNSCSEAFDLVFKTVCPFHSARVEVRLQKSEVRIMSSFRWANQKGHPY